MKKLIWLVVLGILLSGCTTAKTLIMGTDYMDYEKKDAEIEKAYKDGEITKAEYLDLRLKNKQVYQESGTQEVRVEK